MEVGHLLVGGGDVNGIRERAEEDGSEGAACYGGEAVPGEELLPEQCAAGKNQRPDDEDLPLDRQRPEVLQRRGGRGVEGVVVHLVIREVPVLPVEQRGIGLVDQLQPARTRQDDPCRDDHANDDYRRLRYQARESMQPAVEQRRALRHGAMRRAVEEVRKKAESIKKMSTPPETRENQM